MCIYKSTISINKLASYLKMVENEQSQTHKFHLKNISSYCRNVDIEGTSCPFIKGFKIY